MYDSEMMLLGGFLVIYVILMAFVFLLGVAFYVFQAVSLYTVAKRRGLENPWFAWVPICNVYLLGSIADDYNLKVRQKKTNLRKTLLILMLVLIFAAVCMIPLAVFTAASTEAVESVFFAIALILVYLAITGLAVAVTVFEYIAYYRYFQSCDSKNSTLYIILSILISGALPIVSFICKNKDEGMPAGGVNYGA